MAARTRVTITAQPYRVLGDRLASWLVGGCVWLCVGLAAGAAWTGATFYAIAFPALCAWVLFLQWDFQRTIELVRQRRAHEEAALLSMGANVGIDAFIRFGVLTAATLPCHDHGEPAALL